MSESESENETDSACRLAQVSVHNDLRLAYAEGRI